MYHEKPRRRLLWLAMQWVIIAALAAFIAWNVARLWNYIAQDLDTQAAATLRQTVLETAVQCYAVEGAYPESLDYLEQSYGLQINHKKFIVSYEVFASNLLPDVAVYRQPAG